MRGTTERDDPVPGRPQAVLTTAVADAMRAVGGCAAGIYLRTSSPGLLRLSVLSGVPGNLFEPWWTVHSDRPFPIADAHRLGVPVVLTDATEIMRRYPQLAASLPFRFGSVSVPVTAGPSRYGVLAVLRASVPDTPDVLSDAERIAPVVRRLGAALRALEDRGAAITWDREPLCVRPPAAPGTVARVGHFVWDPAAATVGVDDSLRGLTAQSSRDVARSARSSPRSPG